MEPNGVTCGPQLMKLLLAVSLCLADLDLVQLKAKYVTEPPVKMCFCLFCHKVPHPSSEPINL